jgi:HTH-type transcriptional regulator/antitoxin HigA
MDSLPKDLIPYVGSKSKVSEVLSGRRPLSLTMIRKLVAGLRIPAEVALQTAAMPRSKQRLRPTAAGAHQRWSAPS